VLGPDGVLLFTMFPAIPLPVTVEGGAQPYYQPSQFQRLALDAQAGCFWRNTASGA